MPSKRKTRSSELTSVVLSEKTKKSRNGLLETKAQADIEPEKIVELRQEAGPQKEGSDEPRYFLMKAEPDSRIEKGRDVKFSIDDLKRLGTDSWEGVRNVEACKNMRDRMKLGDLAFFYHSNTKTPGIVGIVSVCKEGYPDESAWDETHPYYDPKTNKEKPKWFRVDVKYERHLKRLIGLRELKQRSDPLLASMQLLRRPQLSVQRVSPAEWNHILSLEHSSDGSDIAAGLDTDEERALERAESLKTQAEIISTHGG